MADDDQVFWLPQAPSRTAPQAPQELPQLTIDDMPGGTPEERAREYQIVQEYMRRRGLASEISAVERQAAPLEAGERGGNPMVEFLRGFASQVPYKPFEKVYSPSGRRDPKYERLKALFQRGQGPDPDSETFLEGYAEQEGKDWASKSEVMKKADIANSLFRYGVLEGAPMKNIFGGSMISEEVPPSKLHAWLSTTHPAMREDIFRYMDEHPVLSQAMQMTGTALPFTLGGGALSQLLSIGTRAKVVLEAARQSKWALLGLQAAEMTIPLGAYEVLLGADEGQSFGQIAKRALIGMAVAPVLGAAHKLFPLKGMAGWLRVPAQGYWEGALLAGALSTPDVVKWMASDGKEGTSPTQWLEATLAGGVSGAAFRTVLTPAMAAAGIPKEVRDSFPAMRDAWLRVMRGERGRPGEPLLMEPPEQPLLERRVPERPTERPPVEAPERPPTESEIAIAQDRLPVAERRVTRLERLLKNRRLTEGEKNRLNRDLARAEAEAAELRRVVGEEAPEAAEVRPGEPEPTEHAREATEPLQAALRALAARKRGFQERPAEQLRYLMEQMLRHPRREGGRPPTPEEGPEAPRGGPEGRAGEERGPSRALMQSGKRGPLAPRVEEVAYGKEFQQGDIVTDAGGKPLGRIIERQALMVEGEQPKATFLVQDRQGRQRWFAGDKLRHFETPAVEAEGKAPQPEAMARLVVDETRKVSGKEGVGLEHEARITDASGKLNLATIDYVVSEDGKTLRVIDVRVGPGAWPGMPGTQPQQRLGMTTVRQVLRLLQERHPGVERLTGERISGARQQGQTVPEGKGSEVERPVRPATARDRATAAAEPEAIPAKAPKAQQRAAVKEKQLQQATTEEAKARVVEELADAQDRVAESQNEQTILEGDPANSAAAQARDGTITKGAARARIKREINRELAALDTEDLGKAELAEVRNDVMRAIMAFPGRDTLRTQMMIRLSQARTDMVRQDAVALLETVASRTAKEFGVSLKKGDLGVWQEKFRSELARADALDTKLQSEILDRAKETLKLVAQAEKGDKAAAAKIEAVNTRPISEIRASQNKLWLGNFAAGEKVVTDGRMIVDIEAAPSVKSLQRMRATGERPKAEGDSRLTDEGLRSELAAAQKDGKPLVEVGYSIDSSDTTPRNLMHRAILVLESQRGRTASPIYVQAHAHRYFTKTLKADPVPLRVKISGTPGVLYLRKGKPLGFIAAIRGKVGERYNAKVGFETVNKFRKKSLSTGEDGFLLVPDVNPIWATRLANRLNRMGRVGVALSYSVSEGLKAVVGIRPYSKPMPDLDASHAFWSTMSRLPEGPDGDIVLRALVDPESHLGTHIVGHVHQEYLDLRRISQMWGRRAYGKTPEGRERPITALKSDAKRQAKLGKSWRKIYKESDRRVFTALDYNWALKKFGVDFVKERGWVQREDLNPAEKRVYDLLRDSMDEMRSLFAEHYGVAPEDFGIDNYIYHIFHNSSLLTAGHRARDYRRSGDAALGNPFTMPSRRFFAPEQRRRGAAGYEESAELVYNKYIPSAVAKMRFEKLWASLKTRIYGKPRSLRQLRSLYRLDKDRVLAARDAKQGMPGTEISISYDNRKSWVGYNWLGIRENPKTRAVEVRLWNPHRQEVVTLDGRQLESGRNIRRRPDPKNPNLPYFPRVHMSFQSGGLINYFQQRRWKGRLNLLEAWVKDVMKPAKLTQVEMMGRRMASWFYFAHLARFNLRACSLNLLQNILTISETGILNYLMASDLYLNNGRIARFFGGKDANGRPLINLNRKRALALGRKVLGVDVGWSVMTEAGMAYEAQLGLKKQTPFGVVGQLSSLPWRKIEGLNRHMATMAAYIQARREFAASPLQARLHARNIVKRTQGLYERHMSPRLFRYRVDPTGRHEWVGGLANAALIHARQYKRYPHIYTGFAYNAAKEFYTSGVARTKAPVPPKMPASVDPRNLGLVALSEAERAGKGKAWREWKAFEAKEQMYERDYANWASQMGQGTQSDPGKAMRYVIMAFLAANLAEEMGVDIGLGYLYELPFGLAHYAWNVMQGETEYSLVDTLAPPLVRVVEDANKIIQNYYATDEAKRSPELMQEVWKRLGDSLVGVAPRRWIETLALSKELPPTHPSYAGEGSVAVHPIYSLWSEHTYPEYYTTRTEQMKGLFLPGRRQQSNMTREFFSRSRSIIRDDSTIRENLERHVMDHLSALERGDKEAAARYAAKAVALMMKTGVTMSEATFKQRVERGYEHPIAMRILSAGSKLAQARLFYEALDIRESDPAWLPWPWVEEIQNRIWNDSREARQIPPGLTSQVLNLYQEQRRRARGVINGH